MTAAPWPALHSSGCRRDTDRVASGWRLGFSTAPPEAWNRAGETTKCRASGQLPSPRGGPGGGAGGVQSEGPAASRFTVLRRDSGEGSGTERAAFGFLRALADDSLGHGREHLGQRRGERPREAHAAPPAAPGGQPDFALPQDGGRQAAALARGWNSMAEPRPAVQGGEAELGGNLTTPQR